MNSKNALPWILVLVFAVAGYFLFTSGQTKQKELLRLREEAAELPQLRGALEEAKKAEAQNAEALLTGKEKEELIRLRNEVGVLRRDKQQLSTQVQQAQQHSERLLQTQQAQQSQQVQQLQQQNQQLLQQTQEQKNIQAQNQCINNLRQIDGAIQQWALENKQPADSSVTMQHILPYLSAKQTAPVCPSGGTYTLSNVATVPTCSTPGHALTE